MKRFLRLGIEAASPTAGTLTRCLWLDWRLSSEGCTAVCAGNGDRSVFVDFFAFTSSPLLWIRAIATGETLNAGSVGGGSLPIADVSANARRPYRGTPRKRAKALSGKRIFFSGQRWNGCGGQRQSAATAIACTARPNDLRIAYSLPCERVSTTPIEAPSGGARAERGEYRSLRSGDKAARFRRQVSRRARSTATLGSADRR